MIASPKKGLLTYDLTVKIIDMGSLKPYGAPLTKDRDDHGWFVEHIIFLHNRMLLDSNSKRKSLSSVEKRFLKEIQPLIHSMVEEDKQIALRDPLQITSQFDQAHVRSRNPNKDAILRLEDPFDYISAEHIASDELLVKLFAESCPWAKEVTSPNPILLTGPRGCGKSMLFRRLSLKAMLYKPQKEIMNSQIAGFYISCSADFRNRFGCITSEAIVQKFQREVVHYFNLLLTRELILTLFAISKREDKESIFGLGDAQERNIYMFLISKLDIKKEKSLRLRGITPLEHLIEIIEYEMNYCYEQYLRGFNLEYTTSIPFISDLTKFLKNNIQYFKDKSITFFLDDFSIHRISAPVQIILNQIVWDRQSTHIFKLSAEKFGAEPVLEFNGESASTADITREFREIDCARYYINLSDRGLLQDLKSFAKDLLDHRLVLAGYSGDTEAIIGHSKYENGTLGKSLKLRRKARDHYHGIETISEVCSGDVSALLEIFRNIFMEGKVTKETTREVPKVQQHAAVKRVSGRFRELIKTYHPYGDEMYRVISHFGTLCRKILIQGMPMRYTDLKTGVKMVDNETTRIEMDETTINVGEEWNDEQMKLIKELIRRSIFIEMEPSRGRATLGPTLRWQLRRVYCPSFGTSLRKHTAIKWRMSEFKYFITNPKEKCEVELKKWTRSAQVDELPLYLDSTENYDIEENEEY